CASRWSATSTTSPPARPSPSPGAPRAKKPP
ncbi:uncharacterized protein METZ01_LOCUS229139, partial [marine metagenome]